MPKPSLIAAALAVMTISGAASAEENLFRLTLKDHRFTPERIEVPANVPVVLLVVNQDGEPEEFESTSLKREKIVFPGKEVRVILGRLNSGEYPFVGEYHAATAKGVIVAVETEGGASGKTPAPNRESR